MRLFEQRKLCTGEFLLILLIVSTTILVGCAIAQGERPENIAAAVDRNSNDDDGDTGVNIVDGDASNWSADLRRKEPRTLKTSDFGASGDDSNGKHFDMAEQPRLPSEQQQQQQSAQQSHAGFSSNSPTSAQQQQGGQEQQPNSPSSDPQWQQWYQTQAAASSTAAASNNSIVYRNHQQQLLSPIPTAAGSEAQPSNHAVDLTPRPYLPTSAPPMVADSQQQVQAPSQQQQLPQLIPTGGNYAEQLVALNGGSYDASNHQQQQQQQKLQPLPQSIAAQQPSPQPSQPLPSQGNSGESGSSGCGFTSDKDIMGIRTCHGGWRCGCFIGQAADFQHGTQGQQQPQQNPYQAPTSFSSLPMFSGFSAHEAHRRCKRAGTYADECGRQFYYCFTADTRVQLSDGRTVRMDELRLGDWVLDGNRGESYSLVESWTHRAPETWADFVRVELEDGKVLKLTEKHYIYRDSQCSGGRGEDHMGMHQVRKADEMEMVYAEEVAIGDCLFVAEEGGDSGLMRKRVANITLTYEKGIYAPMTASGTLMVEGILASAYTDVSSPVLQKAAFERNNRLRLGNEGAVGSGDYENEVGLPFGLVSMLELMREAVLPASLVKAW